MPQINNTESERIAKRQNRILYADFLTQQNDYANGLAPAPPVLKSRYGLYNQLALGRLETTPTEQTARLAVTIPSPPALSSSSIRPSATDTSITLTLPVSSAVTSYTYVVSDSGGNPLVPQPTVTGDAATTGQVTFSPLGPGRGYSVVITATGPSGTSVSPPLPIYTLPTTPSGFSATAPTTDGGTISWSGGSGATSYDYIVTDSTNNQVYPSTSGSSSVGIVDNGDSGPATFTGLNPGSRYTITVIPRNPSGIPSSPPATFSIDTAPAAPSAPTSSGSTTNGFSIPLTSSIGATGTPPYIYEVDGIPVTTTSSPVSYAVIGNDVVFTGVSPPGGHTVRIISVSATNVRSPGAVSTVYTTPVAPPSNAFSVTSTSPSAFTLSWTGTTGATSYSYVITANSVPITNPTIVDNGAAGNAVFSNLSPGVTYSVRVTVTNPASSPNSATSSPVTAYTAPNPAVGITQTAGTETSATIAWTGAAGATTFSYNIIDVATQGSVGTGVTASSLLGATLSGLTAGNTYSVVVTATNANGSTVSTAARVYTAPSKPTGVYQVVADTTSTSFTIAWYGGLGATSYVYTLGTTATLPSSDIGVLSQTAKYTQLNPGQPYTPITVTAERFVNPSLTLSTASDTFTSAGTSPAAPTFPASPITGLTSTGFTVTWDTGSGAGAYTYGLSNSAGGPNLLVGNTGPRVASSTANSVTFTGLTPDTDYYPSITASISGFPGSTSSTSVIRTVAAPAAPTATATPIPSNTITSRGVTIGFIPLAGMKYCFIVDTAAAALITSLTPPATTPSYFLSPSPLVVGQATTVQFTGMTSGAAHSVSILATDAGDTTSPPYRYPSTGTFNTADAPLAPTATAAATSTQTSITLTLPTPAAGITYSYSVRGGNPSVALSPQPVPTVSGNTYTFSGLTAGTSYEIAVTATDSAGSKSTYTSPLVPTKSPPPATPTTPATPVSGATSKGFTLTWNAVTGATSYNYSINSGGSTPQGLALNTTTTSLIFSATTTPPLTPDTEYKVQIYSVISGVESTSFLELKPKTLAGPTAITATTSAITATGFTVSWTGGTSPVATNTITYSTTATPPTGGTAVAATVTGSLPTATFTGLISATTYSIVVTATDSAGTVTTSTAITETTSTNLPAAPVISIGPLSVSQSSFIATWQRVPGVTSYTYYLRNNTTNTDSSGNIQQVASGTVFHNMLNLTNRASYTFYVKSNNGQQSNPSNSVTVSMYQPDIHYLIGNTDLIKTIGTNPPQSRYQFIKDLAVGETKEILYISCIFYTVSRTVVTGSAIYKYNLTTDTIVKIAQTVGTNSWNSMVYYDKNLYIADTNKTILKLDTTTATNNGDSILTTYATLANYIPKLTIHSSGKLHYVFNKKVFRITIPSTTPVEIFTIPTPTGTTLTSETYVIFDNLDNLYYNDSVSVKIAKLTNGTYQAPTMFYNGILGCITGNEYEMYFPLSAGTITTKVYPDNISPYTRYSTLPYYNETKFSTRLEVNTYSTERRYIFTTVSSAIISISVFSDRYVYYTDGGKIYLLLAR